MRLAAFSVYDGAVKAYLPPFFVRSRGEAIRSFTEACSDEKHQFFRHSGDYQLYFVGEFDDGLGQFVEPGDGWCGPEFVITALDARVGVGGDSVASRVA